MSLKDFAGGDRSEATLDAAAAEIRMERLKEINKRLRQLRRNIQITQDHLTDMIQKEAQLTQRLQDWQPPGRIG